MISFEIAESVLADGDHAQAEVDLGELMQLVELADTRWEGVSDNGGLRYKAMREIEDCIAGVIQVQDLQRRIEKVLGLHERATVQVLLQLQDLRHMRGSMSVREWRERVDQYLAERSVDGREAA